MTSEGKSARAIAEQWYEGEEDPKLKAKLIAALAEKIESIIERESRLSIAAALEMAIDAVRRTKFRAHSIGDREFESGCKQTRESDLDAIRDLTPEQVAQARAEHDREMREPLVTALERIAWHGLTWREAQDVARTALAQSAPASRGVERNESQIRPLKLLPNGEDFIGVCPTCGVDWDSTILRDQIDELMLKNSRQSVKIAELERQAANPEGFRRN